MKHSARVLAACGMLALGAASLTACSGDAIDDSASGGGGGQISDIDGVTLYVNSVSDADGNQIVVPMSSYVQATDYRGAGLTYGLTFNFMCADINADLNAESGKLRNANISEDKTCSGVGEFEDDELMVDLLSNATVTQNGTELVITSDKGTASFG